MKGQRVLKDSFREDFKQKSLKTLQSSPSTCERAELVCPFLNYERKRRKTSDEGLHLVEGRVEEGQPWVEGEAGQGWLQQ